jgi:hypothetical protein
LLEEAVRSEYGIDPWDVLLEAAQSSGVYTSLGNYPDSDLFALVAAAARVLHLPERDVIRWFGRSALLLLVERYPQFFQGHRSAQSFVLTLNDIIHPEVRKLYPGAYTPDFDFEITPEGALTIGYHSRRKLCDFAVGLIEGAAGHYGETTAIEQPLCMHRGDERCVIQVVFSKAG